MARYTIAPEPAVQEMPSPQIAAPAPGGRYTVSDPDAPSPFLHGLMQGGSMEWADEIAGLLGQDKEAFRKRTKTAADISPSSYQAGKLTGAVATSLLPAGWLLKGGAGIAKAATAGAKLGGGFGAVEALGEYEGKGRSLAEEAPDAALKTVIGAGTGALTGGVLSPVLYSLLAGGRAGGRFLYDYATGGNNAALRKTEQALRRQDTEPATLSGLLTAEATPAVQGTKPEVLADVLRQMQSPAATATDVAAAVNAKHGTALKAPDVGKLMAGFTRANPVPRDLIKLSEEAGGGESGRSGLTSLMQGVASLPGRGREIALRNMGATMEAAPERMVKRLSSETGADLNFRRELANREMRRKSAASKAYREAYQDSYTSPLASALQGGKPSLIADQIRPALGRYALTAHALGGERASHIASALEIMGGVKDSRVPGQLGIASLEQYHTARKSFDKMLSTLNRSPNAADKDAARILGGMRRELNDAVYASNPKFKAADQTFASDMAREEAMRLGRSLNFRSGEAQDEVLAAIKALEARNPTHAEELRDRFMQGAVRRMADEVEISGGIPARWVQPLTGGVRPAPREALESALGAPLPGAPIAKSSSKAAGRVKGEPEPYGEGRETARGVANVLGDEARLKKIFTDVFGNSNTANKLAAQEDLRALPGIAAEMATGGFVGLKNAITKRLMQAMTEKNAEQIAKIVTETDPRILYVALQDIQRMAPKIKAGERIMGVPAAAIGSGLGQTATGR